LRDHISRRAKGDVAPVGPIMVFRGALSSTACRPKPDRQLVEPLTDILEGRLDVEPVLRCRVL
jgi:hypothetical protein